MSWPLPQEFNEAVQNPITAFDDSDLKGGHTIVGPTGLPLPRSGNFADVYQIRAGDGRNWAMKCFTRPVTGLDQRYKKIEDALEKAGLPFTIGFTFLSKGVRVRGDWLPSVKMEWVDGLLVNQVVQDQAGNPKVLDALGQMWSRLCKRLREAGIAHADIQHGNVLLVPGSKPGSYGLKLIDYDGMYVSALANTPSGESGHPNYQHPLRAAKQVYSRDLDRFPHLVVATALKALAVFGPKLWERFDTGDNLLFTEDDFRTPADSKLLKELWQTNNPGLKALVGHLATACVKPLPQTPWLDQIAPDGIAVPLSPEQIQAAREAMGIAPTVTAPAPVATLPNEPPDLSASVSEAFTYFASDQEIAGLSEPSVEKKKAKAKDEIKKSPIVPIAIAAGLLLLMGGIGAAIMLSGGKKPDETAQNQNDEKKDDQDKPRTKPKDKAKPPVDPNPAPPIRDSMNDPTPVRGPNETVNPDVPKNPVSFTPGARWTKPLSNNAQGAKIWYSTDGKSVFVNPNGTGRIDVHDAVDGDLLASFKDHQTKSAIRSVSSLDDGRVLSESSDGFLPLFWNRSNGESKGSAPKTGWASLSSLPLTHVISPNGRYMFVGQISPPKAREPGKPLEYDHSNYSFTDLSTGKEVISGTWNRGTIRFTADSSQAIFYLHPATFRRIDLRTAKSTTLWASQPNTVTDVFLGMSADGSRILYRGRTDKKPNGFYVLDGTTGEIISTIAQGSIHPKWAGISADGRWVGAVQFRSERDKPLYFSILLIDASTGAIVNRMNFDVNVNDMTEIEFAPDLRSFVLADRPRSKITLFDLPRNVVAGGPAGSPELDADKENVQLKWSQAVGNQGAFLWYGRDGKHLFVNSRDGSRIDVRDAATGALGVSYQDFPPKAPMRWVSELTDGRAFAAPFGETALMWDLKTGKDLGWTIKKEWLPPEINPRQQTTYAISPDGHFLFIGRNGALKPNVPGQQAQCEPAPFRLTDTRDGKNLLASSWGCGTALFTRDAKYLLLYDVQGSFRRIELESGSVIDSWNTPINYPMLPTILAASRDGAVLLFHGKLNDHPYANYVVDGKTGRVIRTLANALHPQWGAVSDDGRYVGVVQFEGKKIFVQVREVSTGKLVSNAKIDENVNQISSLQFAPDLGAFALSYKPRGEQVVEFYAFKSGAVVPQPKDPNPVAVTPKPKDPEPEPASSKSERKPVPEEAALAKAEAKLQSLYKSDYAKKQPVDRRNFAVKLLGLAEEAGDDPATRFLMLRDAREFAIEGSDPPLAMQAIEAALHSFELDANPLKQAAFDKMKETAGNLTALRAVAEQAIAASEDAAANDEYAAAVKFAQTALVVVKKGNLPASLAADAETQLSRVQRGSDSFAPVKSALERLKNAPDDVDAAYVVGRHRCFAQGRWDDGLKLLAKGATGGMKAAAEQDLAAPRAGAVGTNLAEAWWSAAQTAPEALERRAMEYRARHWYARALPGLTGAERIAAEKRLAFSAGGVDYQSGLLAEFTAKVPAVLQGRRVRLDRTIAFNAADFKGIDGVGIATDIGVKWTGVLVPQRAGRYRITAIATDPVVIRIDGKIVMDGPSKSLRRSVFVSLPEKPSPMTVDFKCLNTDRHSLKLFWSTPGSNIEVPIPPEVLFHDRKTESILGK